MRADPTPSDTAQIGARGLGEPLQPSDWRVAVWRTFLHSHAVVIGELERELETQAQLPLPSYDVLLTLARAPERRLRMNQLAERVLLSRSGLTRLVDRLEAEDLVRREPSSDDARGVFTVVTAAGLHRLRAASPLHLAGVQRHWLRHYDDAELRLLGELLGRLVAAEPAEPAATADTPGA